MVMAGLVGSSGLIEIPVGDAVNLPELRRFSRGIDLT
jgi:hypothetical protein